MQKKIQELEEEITRLREWMAEAIPPQNIVQERAVHLETGVHPKVIPVAQERGIIRGLRIHGGFWYLKSHVRGQAVKLKELEQEMASVIWPQ